MFKADSATNLTLRTVDTDTTTLTTVVTNSSPSPTPHNPIVPHLTTTSPSSTSSTSAYESSAQRDQRLSAAIIPEAEPLMSTQSNQVNTDTPLVLDMKTEPSHRDHVEQKIVVVEKKEMKLSSKLLKQRLRLSRIQQGFDDIRVFTFFMCLIVMLANALVVGYRNSVVTTIEKRYEFSSVFSGVLSGCLEFGSLLATLFVSYFCSKSHIPRCIAIGSLFCGLGALLYSLPHLLTKLSSTTAPAAANEIKSSIVNANVGSGGDDLMCRVTTTFLKTMVSPNATSNGGGGVNDEPIISSLLDLDSACLHKPSNLWHFVILIVANVLIGSSSAPLYTLGTSYIDQHVEKDNSSVYLAFIYSMLAFGPLVGYLVGAAFLRVYVDFYVQDLKIDPTHSSWIGAWYAGFVLFGVLIFLTAFPFFCFPRTIKKKNPVVKTAEEEKLQVTTVVAAEKSKQNDDDENSFGDFKNLPRAMKRILSNRVFMLVTLGFCFEITIISGFMTFLPKYIEHQFDVDNSLANIYTGGIAIPGACVGIVAGGFIVKRLKINPKSAALMAMICNVICLAGIIVLLFMGCDNIKMAGTTAPYSPLSSLTSSGAGGAGRVVTMTNQSPFNLTSECNSHCHCSTVSIEPVCGENGLTYFSPCHAGCKQLRPLSNDSNQPVYLSCGCVGGGGVARSGACALDRPCRTLLPFLVILFFITLLTALNQMPMLMVTLRSVTEIERAFALGLQLVIMRLLAYIPSPLIFGQAIDWTCVIWRRDECDKTGSCLLYDREKFRNVYGSIAAVYKAISLVLFILLYISVRNKSSYSTNKPPVELSAMMGSTHSLNSNSSHHKKSKRGDNDVKKIKRKKLRMLRLNKSNKKSSGGVTTDVESNNKQMNEMNKMIVI